MVELAAGLCLLLQDGLLTSDSQQNRWLSMLGEFQEELKNGIQRKENVPFLLVL